MEIIKEGSHRLFEEDFETSKYVSDLLRNLKKNGMDAELGGSGEIVKIFLNGSDHANQMLPVFEFIFSHDFLKAYFGSAVEGGLVTWRFRASGLVLSEDRIEYLWKHRPENKQ